MNGVELPCGSILSVEPADMDYKKKQNTEKVDKYDANDSSFEDSKKEMEKSNSTTTCSGQIDNNPSSTKEFEDDNDDLDDFFASL